ncbi:MAG: phosphoribosylanthranilate isomerase [Candidatus Sumerlaeota bacterium]|nr:phosphoribosylanthranilate isomerase [Candidatus Sumerlaeota bacterium]
MPRIKVCCISSILEARLAIEAGASLIGLVSEMPSGPGVISDERVAEIADAVPPGVTSVLLTARTRADAIIEQHRRCRTNALQLVDALPAGEHRRLRDALPGIGIIQVLHVRGEEALREAEALASEGAVDALLLDSGNPGAAVKELGGTGRVHDWSISERLCRAVDLPVFLAGGLHSGNVAEAVRQVRPFGLDLCSGVRTECRLDAAKLGAFMQAVRSAG